jgi:hypothetical protein
MCTMQSSCPLLALQELPELTGGKKKLKVRYCRFA